MNLTSIASGSHTLKIVATDTAGNSSFSQVSFVAGVTGTTAISGWALESVNSVGPNAVSSATVSVDGNPVGTATYSIARPDVCAAFPGRPGCPNVGWSLTQSWPRLNVG